MVVVLMVVVVVVVVVVLVEVVEVVVDPKQLRKDEIQKEINQLCILPTCHTEAELVH